MTTNWANAAFKSTGSTTSRTEGDRAADIINVRDYGAVGDGSHNDAPNIQAAIDACFGSAGSPHGDAGRYSNRSRSRRASSTRRCRAIWRLSV